VPAPRSYLSTLMQPQHG